MIEKKRKHPGSTRSNPQAKFSKKQIHAIIDQLENGELTRTEACHQYGMAYCTITDWMKRYSSSASKNSRVQLTAQQQRQAARAIMEGRMTIHEVQAAYGISRPDTVRRWVRILKQQNNELTALQQSSSDMPLSSEATCCREQDKELKEAKLKIAALETMIDIAEQHFSISIRKKSGAKQ